jgi:hypothetical protein
VPPRPHRVPIFWIGFLVLLVARGAVALSRLDELRGEEMYQGTLAWAWMHDFPLDPESLPIIVHLRGSVVFAALAVPFFGVLGPSFLALRLVAVLWSAAAGGLLGYVLERGVGRRAALAGIALAAVFPPAYLMVDTAAYGSHMDSVLPTLAALAVVVARAGPLGWRRTVPLGLALGFGAFFSLQCVVAAPAVVLAWWGHDRGLWRRASSLGVLAAVGPAACIPLVSRTTTLVTKSMSGHVLPEGLGGAWAKLSSWFGGDAVRVMLFEVNGPAWLGVVYAAAAGAALVLLVPRVRRREPLALFALAHPVAVFGAWVISDFELNFQVTGGGMGSRYLMPVMPAVAIALVLGAWALRSRTTAAALVGAALASGAVGFAGLLDARPFLALPPRLGTSFAFFEAHFRHAGGWRERVELARAVDPDWGTYRPLVYRILAPDDAGPANRPPGAGAWQAVRALQVELRPYVLVHLGHRAVEDPSLARMAAALAALPADLPPEEARWYRLGVGRGMMIAGMAAGIFDPQRLEPFYHVLGAAPAEHAPDVMTGAGFQLGRLFSPYHDNVLRTLAASRLLPAAPRARFHAGLALGWRTRFRESTWTVPAQEAAKIERLLAPEDRPAFRTGLALPADALGPT